MIATTSSPEKIEKLKKLGADHVINYKEDEKWGETAKSLTPNQEGVNHILEVGGPATIAQVGYPDTNPNLPLTKHTTYSLSRHSSSMVISPSSDS